MNTVKAYAGRVQGGDFKWEFTDSDNPSYAINTGLKAAIAAYKSFLVSTNVGTSTGSGSGSGSTGGDVGGETPTPTPTPEGVVIHNFHTSGKSSDFFKINGNLSSSKGTITYEGQSLTQCLKIESSTSITFTLTEARTLTLVFNPKASINIDGAKHTSNTNIITVELGVGTHTLTKADSTNLYYIVLE